MTTILTIGHSNHPTERFLGLLKAHGIALLADIRSKPASRFSPQFGGTALARSLAGAGIAYRWLGEGLGGKPRDSALYHSDGHPDYARMAASRQFAGDLEVLLGLAAQKATVIMCAERDPQKCHRNQLVTPALLARGVAVKHILADGTLVAAALQTVTVQQDLFG